MNQIEALRTWIAEPVALQLATCGAGLAPQSVRAFGVALDDRGALSVGIVDAQAPRLLAALQVGNTVAINLTHPLTFHGRQVKGPLLEVEQPSAEAAQVARAYFDRFVVLLAKIGMTPEQCRGMFYSGATRFVRMAPLEFFDQSPGVGAGARL